MRPFIIWTLQRTGGTNFAVNVISQSGLPNTEHEPLNPGRAYGSITTRWIDLQDRATLMQDIEAFLSKGYAIKHCVETIPWAVNASLLEASAIADYNHLILHREDSVARLLSLHFARETGIWGRKKAASLKETKGDGYLEELNVGALSVPDLVQHEDDCLNSLADVVACLLERQANVFVLSYEEIYSGAPYRHAPLYAALDFLGLDPEDRHTDFLQKLTGAGDQGSKPKYKEFAGLDALQSALANIPSLKQRLKGPFTHSKQEQFYDR